MLRRALEAMQAEILRALKVRDDDTATSRALARIRKLRLLVDQRDLERVYRRTEKQASIATKGLIGIAPAIGPRALAAFRRQNAELIRTLQGSQIQRVQRILREGANLRVEEIAASLQEAFAIESRHAELIARDQVLTIHAQVTREQHKSAGIERYTWSTSNDERVRDDHVDLDGNVYSYDDPPVIDSRTGDRGHPGDGIQCRCVAVPVVPWLDED